MAEAITRRLASGADVGGQTLGADLELASAGTGSWHRGESMDPRAEAALRRAGYPREGHVARQISWTELARADLVVALDRGHRADLRKLGASADRLVLLRAFESGAGPERDVPDPYHGDDAGFDRCRETIETACSGLVWSLTTHWATLWGNGADRSAPSVRD
jgi:protein-tyrosine phosphatase